MYIVICSIQGFFGYNHTTYSININRHINLKALLCISADGIALGAATVLAHTHLTMIVFIAIMLHKVSVNSYLTNGQCVFSLIVIYIPIYTIEKILPLCNYFPNVHGIPCNVDG